MDEAKLFKMKMPKEKPDSLKSVVLEQDMPHPRTGQGIPLLIFFFVLCTLTSINIFSKTASCIVLKFGTHDHCQHGHT